jgi:hypothetical protein
MDVEFMLCKSVEEAAKVVDEILNGTFRMAGGSLFLLLVD